jgi:CRP-like cAMP-binding protein
MTSAMPPHARPFSGDEAAGRRLTSEGLVSQALVALGLIGPGEAEALKPLLARCRRVEVAAGTVVLAGHSANSCAAILLAGRLAVQLRAGAGPEMGSVAVGELVGEVSALTGSPTSAWVIASEPSALLELERDTLLELANRSHQFAVRMLRTVCERLYSSNLQALSSDDASREFRRKAFFDQLTGLKNRTWLSQHLPPLLAAQAEHDEGLHLFMVDIDHFKRFNDTWGHAAGDQVLVAVGQENAFPWIETDIGLEFDEWHMPKVDQASFQSTLPSVFFGGDAAFGPKNIIWAVAHGHDAAVSIHKFCQGDDVSVRPPPGAALQRPRHQVRRHRNRHHRRHRRGRLY